MGGVMKKISSTQKKRLAVQQNERDVWNKQIKNVTVHQPKRIVSNAPIVRVVPNPKSNIPTVSRQKVIDRFWQLSLQFNPDITPDERGKVCLAIEKTFSLQAKSKTTYMSLAGGLCMKLKKE